MTLKSLTKQIWSPVISQSPFSHLSTDGKSMSKPASTTLSIIVPIFNEEQVIPELYKRITAVMDEIGESWELVCINDGSSDRSAQMLVDLNKADPRVKLLELSRNFGHQLAITAGLDYAEGDAVVIIDADLQDPPEVIAEMLARWREGYGVVYAVRADRKGESFFKLWTANAFYRLLRSITED